MAERYERNDELMWMTASSDLVWLTSQPTITALQRTSLPARFASSSMSPAPSWSARERHMERCEAAQCNQDAMGAPFWKIRGWGALETASDHLAQDVSTHSGNWRRLRSNSGCIRSYALIRINADQYDSWLPYASTRVPARENIQTRLPYAQIRGAGWSKVHRSLSVGYPPRTGAWYAFA